jgi:hypothetical protein
MDLWAANLPSEILELHVENFALSAQPKQPHSNGESSNPVVSPSSKRKRLDTEDNDSDIAGYKIKRVGTMLPSMDEPLTSLDTPPYKAPTVEVLAAPHNSSLRLHERVSR